MPAQAGLTAALDALEHPAVLLMALSVDGKADEAALFEQFRTGAPALLKAAE